MAHPVFNICRASSQKSQSQRNYSPLPLVQKKKKSTTIIKLTEPRKTERERHVSKNRGVSQVQRSLNFPETAAGPKFTLCVNAQVPEPRVRESRGGELHASCRYHPRHITHNAVRIYTRTALTTMGQWRPVRTTVPRV